MTQNNNIPRNTIRQWQRQINVDDKETDRNQTSGFLGHKSYFRRGCAIDRFSSPLEECWNVCDFSDPVNDTWKWRRTLTWGKTEGLKNLVSEGLMMGGNEAMSCEVRAHTWHRADGKTHAHANAHRSNLVAKIIFSAEYLYKVILSYFVTNICNECLINICYRDHMTKKTIKTMCL